MSDFQLTGILITYGEVQQVSEKFAKREFAVKVEEGKYPQTIAFQLSQERCDIIEAYAVGQIITVNFNLKGREWFDANKGETRYFNTLEAWKIQPAKTETPTAPPAPKPASAPPPMRPVPVAELEGPAAEDDLPF